MPKLPLRLAFAVLVLTCAYAAVAMAQRVCLNGACAGVFSTIVGTSLDTGQGPFELYAMNQNVRTSDPVAFTGVTSNQNGIATTPTAGFSAVNDTDAALGAQQISPAAFFRGRGYDTVAVASKTIDMYQYMLPVQAAGNPTGVLVWAYAQNGGTVTSACTMSVPSGTMACPNFAATGLSLLSSGSTITVDAATTFAITASYHVLACTGAETINTITGAANGTLLYLENSDTDCTIADDDAATAANAIDLTGATTNDVGAVAKVLVLLYTGTHWKEVTESDN